MPRSTLATQRQAGALIAAWHSDSQIARILNLNRSTVWRWRRRGFPTRVAFDSLAAAGWRPPDARSYAFLLGLYLGDGCVVNLPRTDLLVISLDGLYPDLIDECVAAIEAVLPDHKIRVKPGSGRGVRVESTSKMWPFIFPQHGPGPKHERKIALVDWQREIVDEHPRAFLRGLIHSDGCRCVNEFTVQLKAGPKRYSYVRYFFSNLSADIRGLVCEACDRIGVRWSMSNKRNVSISDRASVALLDEFVGPKR